METVLKDLPYYRRSGGGVTLSGGEFLFQPEFSHALLAACREVGLNTAVESTGGAPFEVIEPMLPLIDHYLMDIKHINSEKHRAFTGRPNDLILENAPKIAQRVPHMVVRVPVIPTFNDTEEEIADIARFAATLRTVHEIHLLPYHRLGLDKYEGLGRTYTLPDIVPPTEEHMERLRQVAERSGLMCQIGG